MSAISLDGERLAARWRAGIAADAAALKARGIAPKMATVLVGDDPASAAYIGRKHADCLETGIEALDIRLPADATRAELLEQVDRLNRDPSVHGLMVQLPLPAPLDEDEALAAVAPHKDIDGLHPANLGRLLAGRPGLLPCTPAAILGLLSDYDVPLAGRRVAILGRGPLVGRPLAMLLSLKDTDATVTLLHSRSPDIAGELRRADVVVAAIGVAGYVTAGMVKPGAAVVGVGISYTADGRMVSDVAEEVTEVAGLVTPPHGSVGALTRAALLRNLISAARPA
ncbi:bifunctional 5,10-methylenetetrahydrofolate dehydrogenase/5,10-methenyltetrahydrofolate cyclohydrolase [Rhizobiaceae bacterium BDR2-2]|uniref:Bifunctional protein FolD n=1 Tax=Ectorhizobium quercum TaxID=2965071 RepID=A0AAE3SXD6_9HYPH|nr:bifunctional 5,10-methylenetetrahydrofolate dehydrogenase/5,10-methenyltetrahydrofolate cyclohydrolase [Ectorhizobium quercum]MCX8998380.1 bifunctional 5,10-methylenetetrahydrofolate dehydrogenase/5,10-methenyltetrahydrofolate cyclohydrolase [Ectorhizobium quercum]